MASVQNLLECVFNNTLTIKTKQESGHFFQNFRLYLLIFSFFFTNIKKTLNLKKKIFNESAA